MIVAHIDKDYLYDGKDEVPNRVGREWTSEHLVRWWGWAMEPLSEDNKVRFRLLDDDEEVYYGGWLLNDGECVVQQLLLEWSGHDSGCTIIEIKKDKEWVREIG